MKEMRSIIISGLVGCGVALAMVSTLTAQTPLDGKVTVIRIKGAARYVVAKGNWKPLRIGQVLQPGTIVETDLQQDSYVDLVLGLENGGIVPTIHTNFGPSVPVGFKVPVGQRPFKPATSQNVVRLFGNTILGVDKLTYLQTGIDVVTDTQLDLKAGHIAGVVKKMSAGSRYYIKLPKAIAGIRGTVYDLYADGRAAVSGGSMVIVPYKSVGGQEVPTVPEAGAPPGTTTITPDTTAIPAIPPAPGTTPGQPSGSIVLTGDQSYDPETGKITDGTPPAITEIGTIISVPGTTTPPPVISDLTIQNVSPTASQP